MLRKQFKVIRTPLAAALAAAFAAWAPSSDARVTRIVIDKTERLCVARDPNNPDPNTNCTAFDNRYQQLTGRAFGELDPNDGHNDIITDIALAEKNANGKVPYIATFVIRRPTVESN